MLAVRQHFSNQFFGTIQSMLEVSVPMVSMCVSEYLPATFTEERADRKGCYYDARMSSTMSYPEVYRVLNQSLYCKFIYSFFFPQHLKLFKAVRLGRKEKSVVALLKDEE